VGADKVDPEKEMIHEVRNLFDDPHLPTGSIADDMSICVSVIAVFQRGISLSSNLYLGEAISSGDASSAKGLLIISGTVLGGGLWGARMNLCAVN
jgi:hypothetical protein